MKCIHCLKLFIYTIPSQLFCCESCRISYYHTIKKIDEDYYPAIIRRYLRACSDLVKNENANSSVEFNQAYKSLIDAIV